MKTRETARRPIEPAEVEHLEAAGRHLRELRERAGLTRDDVGRASGLHPQHIARLERGTRRTRLSTLEAIAAAFPEDVQGGLVDRFVELAGPALADESPWRDRVERRRERRLRKRRNAEAAALAREKMHSGADDQLVVPAGQRVRASRVMVGLSAVELAAIADVDEGQLGRAESSAPVRRAVLHQLAEAVVLVWLESHMDIDADRDAIRQQVHAGARQIVADWMRT